VSAMRSNETHFWVAVRAPHSLLRARPVGLKPLHKGSPPQNRCVSNPTPKTVVKLNAQKPYFSIFYLYL
jgi:hypothetical protein